MEHDSTDFDLHDLASNDQPDSDSILDSAPSGSTAVKSRIRKLGRSCRTVAHDVGR